MAGLHSRKWAVFIIAQRSKIGYALNLFKLLPIHFKVIYTVHVHEPKLFLLLIVFGLIVRPDVLQLFNKKIEQNHRPYLN